MNCPRCIGGKMFPDNEAYTCINCVHRTEGKEMANQISGKTLTLTGTPSVPRHEGGST